MRIATLLKGAHEMETSTIETVDVTPAMATSFLEKNKLNRKLSTRIVEQYAEQMRQGIWHYDGNAIKFDTRGNLIDGQHRLWAIVESETTQRMLIVRDLADEVFDTLDTGKRRTLPDVISIHYPDMPQLNTVAAVVQLVYRYERGDRAGQLRTGKGMRPVAVPVLMEFLAEHKDAIMDVARRAHSHSQRIPAIAASALGLAYWVLEAIDKEDADFFFDRLMAGAGLEEGSPILALRNALYRFEQSNTNSRTKMTADYAVALLFKAWNAFRDGTEIKQLTYKVGGAKPEQFPVPR